MSRNIYDNGEKLVVAILRKEKDRQLEHCESFSTTYSTDFGSCFSFEVDLPAEDFEIPRYWREFVIANGLFKKLCLRLFPSFARILETNDSGEWDCLEREHRVYSSLCKDFITSARENCISDVIYASSTDHYPRESIKNTLHPSDKIGGTPSYWSSKGTRDPSAPETLLYKLATQLCVITEFHVHPYQEYFGSGYHIFSAKAVRFHMGYSKKEKGLNFVTDFQDDNFVWTYSSPEFPMAQKNLLQKFELPEPVICIGGILRVELLGRVQTHTLDGLYYIGINHVQAIGRPLSPVFVEMYDERGIPKVSNSQFHRLSGSLTSWEQQALNTFGAAGPL